MEDKKMTAKLQYFYDLLADELDSWEDKILLAKSEESRKVLKDVIESGIGIRDKFLELFREHVFDDEENSKPH